MEMDSSFPFELKENRFYFSLVQRGKLQECHEWCSELSEQYQNMPLRSRGFLCSRQGKFPCEVSHCSTKVFPQYYYFSLPSPAFLNSPRSNSTSVWFLSDEETYGVFKTFALFINIIV